MSLLAAQRALIDQYLLIEDSQERFSAIVARARTAPPFPEELRTDEHRVPGCTSRVWLAGWLEGGAMRFQGDAESSILKGVIALLVELYSGHPPGEVMAVEPDLLRELRILDQLTPTRRNGLRQVRARILALAEASRLEGMGEG